MTAPDRASPLPAAPDRFVDRLVGEDQTDLRLLLAGAGVASLEQLIDETIPQAIRFSGTLDLAPARSERQLLEELKRLAARNRVFRSYIGMGYHGTVTPPVILRNVFENPGWYTQYTPYQAEISQGRLEALLNFQTMICDLTGLPVANASLLDEGTAAAEAMTLCHRMLDKAREKSAQVFLVAQDCHPQTIEVVKSRAEPLGFEVVVTAPEQFRFDDKVFGALVQNPATGGRVFDVTEVAGRAHAAGARLVVATDLLALTLLRPPGESGADVAVGSSQRFGVPLFYGGPHAAFLAAREECLRKLPGRVVGVSKDGAGRPALRLALQTREQHIRRDRATSNICTAQVLLAVGASMYAVYHGPRRLKAIAERVHVAARALAAGVAALGHGLRHTAFFDTLKVAPAGVTGAAVVAAAAARGINLRLFADGDVGVALDETVESADLADVLAAFAGGRPAPDLATLEGAGLLPPALRRSSPFLGHEVFNSHHTEHEFLRYLKRLESRDLSLTTSMISLGSCTMKLNPTAEMIPISFEGFAAIHPFAPAEQVEGYRELIDRLSRWLCELTGFAACSMQPNAGSQGEYAGLLVIRAWHQSQARGAGAPRDVCLIPASAHGTNPASAVLAGMRVVAVRCDDQGNIDLEDLRQKSAAHAARLAALMVTYPSTHGVFEEAIKEICAVVHDHGGQVYLDGANMNAMVGLCRPGDFGADVCHLNLHKTFGIPHGGGGPGMGPICVAAHLAPFLPSHPVVRVGGERAIGAVSAAPFGSAGILPISYAFIALLGREDIAQVARRAILNANYLAARLDPHFPVLYRGRKGRVAHECIIDLRGRSARSGIDIEDVAKRLMDYGFHAPTMSFPVPGTLMIEPTESESRAELDRFIEAMVAIRREIQEVEEGRYPKDRNVLKGAPHTAAAVSADDWDRPYPRGKAAYPVARCREHKFWPVAGRVDNVHGDRHPCCVWNAAE